MKPGGVSGVGGGEIGDFLREKSLTRGVFWGKWGNRDLLHEETPSSGENFGTGGGDILGLFLRRIPLKGRKSGRRGADAGVKMGTKKGPAAICYEPSSGSLFERFYARLITDVIKSCKRLF